MPQPTATTPHPTAPGAGGIGGVLSKLHDIKLGGGGSRMKRRDLIAILSNLSTLVDNGVSLPKSLATLAREKSLKKHAPLLDALRRRIESGQPFSSALAAFPEVFDDLMVNQIRIGERSGSMASTIARMVKQLEQSSDLWSKILKRLSYPIIVVVAGALVSTFMLLYIVPVFEETYNKAKIPLPLPTALLIEAGHWVVDYGWMAPVGLVLLIVAYRRVRKSDDLAYRMDRSLLRTPLVGVWLRDMAVLQFVDVLSIMLESGFKLVDALAVCSGSIGNRAVRRSVDDLRSAVIRGERLSRELSRHEELYPPVVSQLVIVGESTGNLSKATCHVRDHLRREVERKADTFVSAIEPVLTIGMAAGIGGILLAIYMPMFGMADAVDTGP